MKTQPKSSKSVVPNQKPLSEHPVFDVPGQDRKLIFVDINLVDADVLQAKLGDAYKVVAVPANAFVSVTHTGPKLFAQIQEVASALQRLTDHVNRELGVAQDEPLHQRVHDDDGHLHRMILGEEGRIDYLITRVDADIDDELGKLRRAVEALEQRLEKPEWFSGVDQTLAFLDSEVGKLRGLTSCPQHNGNRSLVHQQPQADEQLKAEPVMTHMALTENEQATLKTVIAAHNESIAATNETSSNARNYLTQLLQSRGLDPQEWGVKNDFSEFQALKDNK